MTETMVSRLVVAIDVGTTSAKAVLADSRRGIIGSCQMGYPLLTPRPGWVDQDMLAIRAAVIEAVRRLLRESATAPIRVDAIVLTAQMFSLQPVDATGEPCGPMISWLDQRASGDAARLLGRVPRETQARLAGSVITAKDIVARIHWLRDADPDRWAATRWLLDCKESLVAWLTGHAVIDPAGASAYRLTDVRSGTWDPALCELLDVPLDRLPAVAPSTSVAGGLLPGPAAALGLPQDLPVFVGAGDVPASQIGSGAVRPGDVHLSLGTAIYLGVHSDTPLADPAGNLGVLCHPDGDAWILWLEIAAGGASVAWVGRALSDPTAPDAPIDHERLEQLAASVEGDTDDLLFAPWLSGERVPLFDDDARGAFVGLALRHGRAHLVRAVMEGVAYQIRWAWEYGQAFGIGEGTIRVVGGGGVGEVWLGIIADVLGRTIEIVDRPQDAAAMGAAAIAFTGLGAWPSLATIGEHTGVHHVVTPDAERARRYDAGSRRFRAMYQALRPIMHDLHA